MSDYPEAVREYERAVKVLEVPDWEYIANRADAAIAALKAQLAWTEDRLRERIKELEGEVEDLTESNNTWLEVAREVCAELGIDGVLLAHAPEAIRTLKSELSIYVDLAHDDLEGRHKESG